MQIMVLTKFCLYLRRESNRNKGSFLPTAASDAEMYQFKMKRSHVRAEKTTALLYDFSQSRVS